MTIVQVSKQRIIDVVTQVVPDQEAQDIIFYLRGKKNISEFIVAEELDLEIHRTRNLLYRLLDNNLVSFIRKKDKIKGWYICYWDFNEDAVNFLEDKLRNQTLEKLRERYETESNGMFYMCKYAHARMKFDDAFEENFKCPECGELMNQVDNSRTLEFLESRIAELEAQANEPKPVVKVQEEEPVKKLVAKTTTAKKPSVKKTVKKSLKKAPVKKTATKKKSVAKKTVKKAVTKKPRSKK